MDRPPDGYTMIGLLGQKHWDDPITEDPKAGSMEIWSFANATGDVHPMHLHLVQFQILNRQPFDVKTYMTTGKLNSSRHPHGRRNPTSAPPGKTRSKPTADSSQESSQNSTCPPEQAKPGDEFRYVWHCHVLEHEDNEMMRPYKIVA